MSGGCKGVRFEDHSAKECTYTYHSWQVPAWMFELHFHKGTKRHVELCMKVAQVVVYKSYMHTTQSSYFPSML